MNRTNSPNPWFPKGRVLFVGQCYYNAWYLSRALRRLGWKADVLNWDASEQGQQFYHGEDFKFTFQDPENDMKDHIRFYIRSLDQYDIFHFSGARNMQFGWTVQEYMRRHHRPPYFEIELLKRLGKKIVYTNNGCLDGVSQSSFRKWPGPEPMCDSCKWANEPSVCSDERNLAWGEVRNHYADYQCNLGGNRADYNDDDRVHEVPQVYSLDTDFWRPDLAIPDRYRLPFSQDTIKIYHGVGNFAQRSDGAKRNVKSTHIYLPLIDRLKAEGYKVELIFCTDVPNKEVRFFQAQADIVVDMLTAGFFGANIREALMLGKPAICYIRPVWAEGMRKEIPEYVDELPVVSATPDTVYAVLKDLIEHPQKRQEIGRRSREFAVKWFSAEAGARRMDQIYSALLRKRPHP